MHLGYLEEGHKLAEQAKEDNEKAGRRSFLKKAGAAIMVGGVAPSVAFGMSSAAEASDSVKGFKGQGRMGMSTGEDWIDTFFNEGAAGIIHYYADDFVFEDITLFQTITDKEELYNAFLPFNKDSNVGKHYFDVVRYDGGLAGDRTAQLRLQMPPQYQPAEWDMWTKDTLEGADHSYDEWGVMQWVWKSEHYVDFLGLPATGKTTHTRGMTFHCYKDRKVVREYTYWNFRDVAIQLGVLPAPNKFWKKK
ncbi:hypothetical protein [Zhongshania aliphaticivorans]|jgi:steroid delta-isomerase-like uncharacterized protein|uniref:hypothetical protein n=1 Tax=Zhongshania aliphaticivorans TaxID=1470434 RepID=UPI0012E6DE21|nr:hypothetical protein [Zhongshania aliphaticivorans]CAA0107642.1 Uncharacterised protein [Zhongshania aliphaticivorans]